MSGTHQARFCSLHWVIYLALVCLGKEISYHDHALCAGEWCQRGPSQQAGASVSTNSAIPCLKWAGTCPDKRGWGSDTGGGWSVPAVRKAKRLSLPLSPGPSQWLGRATESPEVRWAPHLPPLFCWDGCMLGWTMLTPWLRPHSAMGKLLSEL